MKNGLTKTSNPTGGDTDPDNPDMGKYRCRSIYRDRQTVTTQEKFKDYDVIMNYFRGGPGFGDPLERNPKCRRRFK